LGSFSRRARVNAYGPDTDRRAAKTLLPVDGEVTTWT